MTPKAEATKTKINRWNYIRLWKASAWLNQQNEKETNWTGESIYKWYIQQETNIQNNTKNSCNSTTIKTNIELKNMQRTWIDIFLKKTYRWPTGMWKDAPPSLIIREIQIKATASYHLTPVRMAIIKKIRNNKCWWGCQEKGMSPFYSIIGNVNWYSQCGKQYGGSSKKKKIELPSDQISHSVMSDSLRPHDPAIPLLDMHLKKTEVQIWIDTCIPWSLQHCLP